MKIARAIKEADTLYENPFPLEQKIAWCDELGALLKNEYAKTFKSAPAELADGDYLLPEGMDFSEVLWFLEGERRISKEELQKRGYGVVPFSARCKIKPLSPKHPIMNLNVVYLEQYTPITDIYTDETVAKSPYDRMYIDFLIAKCNYYNRDFQGYNQHMTYFNNLLTGFAEDYIRKHEPPRRDIKGWW